MSSGAPPEQDRQECDKCDRVLSRRTAESLADARGCPFCREDE
ncbi:hypothetical protein [Halosimplex marinum]